MSLSRERPATSYLTEPMKFERTKSMFFNWLIESLEMEFRFCWWRVAGRSPPIRTSTSTAITR